MNRTIRTRLAAVAVAASTALATSGCFGTWFGESGLEVGACTEEGLVEAVDCDAPEAEYRLTAEVPDAEECESEHFATVIDGDSSTVFCAEPLD